MTTTHIQQDDVDTVIGSTVTVEGNLECSDSILIDGKFVGTIITTKEITVGVNATVEGNIKAAQLFISGLVRGNIVATDSIELMSSARLYGDVDTGTISIQKGAVMQGECMTGKKETASTTSEKENASSVQEAQHAA